ncbi:hypothetical protein KBB96_05140 [Luteolibacter ambystomatis]|uniref:Uncharacterized protein n=1 Tax=Luteolibacter ambystomatis TaxID=2824561 RepID=A0A975J1G2_9BACT|nr:hypothetical protein [Luteolibacter ambystomatis]QUE52278.1 hypothetical protein KBB96_05140 [Luteolibacter ambystomatis]
MKWWPIITRWPKWAIAGGIVVISSLVFALWWLNRGSGNAATKPVAEANTPSAFEIEDAVLCGNALVNYRTGELIAKEWLEGAGDNPPNITKVLPEQRLVIVSGYNGMVGAFGFDGKAKPILKADKKPTGSAGFNQTYSEVVYVRDGDLWHGSVNWSEGNVDTPRKVTDVGYFRPETFRGRWLWHEGDLLVPVLGKTLQVGLSSGSVKEVPVNLGQLEQGMSPLGTFAVVPVGGRELGVVDLLNGETTKFNVGQRIRKFLWLTPTKVVLHIGNNQIAQYDHSTKSLVGPQQSDDGIRDIAAPSPDGNCFLVIGGQGIAVLDLNEKKDFGLKLQFNEVQWISDQELLCSCNEVDTDHRGVWLVTKAGEMNRVSNLPMDSGRAGGPRSSPVARTRDGALFVSGGNLWSFNIESKSVMQLTQTGTLQPQVRLLAK